MAIVEDVNLVVTKTFADDSVDAGTVGHTFTIDVQNTGVSEADNISLTDTVDPRLIVTGVARQLHLPGRRLEPADDHLHAGAPRGGRHEDDHGHLPRRGLDSGGCVGLEHGVGDRRTTAAATPDSDTVAITTHADVADVKVDSPDPVLAGNDLTFRITASNDGPSDAQNVVAARHARRASEPAEVLPRHGPRLHAAGSVDGLGQPRHASRRATSVDVVITATVDPSTPEDYVIDNTATITTRHATIRTSATTRRRRRRRSTPQADLSVTKTAPATATAGDPAGFDYTLTVHNGGPSDNTGGFHVTDTLRPGLTFQTAGSSADCSARGQLVTCTNTTGLAAGANQAFTVHVTLASTVDSGTDLANSATVASDGTLDPNARQQHEQHDAHDGRPRTCTSRSRRRSTRDTVTAGGAAQTFTIDVTNSGVSDADNVSLTDTVDPRLVVDSITAGDYTCGAPSQSISCTLGASRRGRDEVDHGHLPRRHDDRTAPRACGNTAHAASDEDTATPSTDTVDDRRGRAALRVTKTFDSDTVTAGGAAQTFTVDVHNAGVSDADNLSLTDTVDSRLIVRLDRRRATTPAARRASRSPARSRISRRARRSRSRSPTTSTSTTDSAAGVRNTATRPRTRTRRRLGHDSRRHRRERAALASTKTFDSRHGHGRRRGAVVHDRRAQRRRLGRGQPEPDRHGRLAADRRLDRRRRLQLRRARASRSPARSAHLAAGATKSITVTTTSRPRRTAIRASATRRDAASDEDTRDSGTDSVAIVEDVQLVGRRRRSTRDTVTAGGASADLHDRREQQRRLGRRQREPDRHGRLAAGRRLDRRRRLHVRLPEPVDLLHARASRGRRRRSRSPSTTTSTRRRTARRRRATRRTRTPTRTTPTSGTRHGRRSSRTCSSSVTKTFDSDTVTAGGSSETFTIDGAQRRRLGCRQPRA